MLHTKYQINQTYTNCEIFDQNLHQLVKTMDFNTRFAPIKTVAVDFKHRYVPIKTMTFDFKHRFAPIKTVAVNFPLLKNGFWMLVFHKMSIT